MSVAKLRLRLAGTGDEELILNRPELTIGRALDNDLILNDTAVSLHHARIARRRPPSTSKIWEALTAPL